MGSRVWFYPFIVILILLLQYAYSAPSLSHPSNHSCPYDHSSALLQFKQTFTIDTTASSDCAFYGQTSEPKMKYWKRGTDCCTWPGVTCDWRTGHVVGLDLSCSQLQGIIPSNSTLFQLSHLKTLNLAFNDLDGSPISSEFGGFAPDLTHLNLSHSAFIGKVSSKISHLSKLISLDLSDNQDIQVESQNFELLIQNLTQLTQLSLSNVNISSVLPMNLSSSLTFLHLSFTGLHGKLPHNIFNILPNLKELDLSGNDDLNGPFPEVNVSTRSNPLRRLDISETRLDGQLPDSIGYLRSLDYLNLPNCRIFGSIPESLGNLTQITYLDISRNNLSGKIPSTLSNLKHLTHLAFTNNHLDGQIPNVFANLTSLSSIYLADNKFSGPFPSSIATLTQLDSLGLSSNLLTGPIPSNIVGLHNLTYLNIRNNSFNGTLTSWLFALPSLNYLDLSFNQFTGQIHEFRSTSLSSIRLNNNDLHGPIPNSFSKLVNLSRLDLSWNNFTGTVQLGMFSNLTYLMFLHLSNNNLFVTTNINARFPRLRELGLASCNMKELPYLSKDSLTLEFLDLSYNQIHGQLPPNFSLLHKLYSLQLQSNFLQGPLPSPICSIHSLGILDLSNNEFSGTIPQCLGNFSLGLLMLNLRMNRFHGPIPITFGAEENYLESLNLHGNKLEGALPRSLSNCTNLKVLDLGNNLMNDTFPHWLRTLPKLQVLVLRYNRFHGPISSTSKTSKFLFSNLRIIDLSHNQFTGFLPSQYFINFKAMMNVEENETERNYMLHNIYRNYYDEITLVVKGVDTHIVRILTVFTTIDFSSNNFEGEIPNSIENLNSLRVLNFSHNRLTNHIPSVLANLSVLESLDFSSNQFVGQIPQQLTALTFLAVLNLSQNHLVGPIPQGLQFNTFQTDSYNGNTGLCGFSLSKKCRDGETPHPSIVQQEEDSDFASGFTWKVVLMGYGCGTVFGLVMGYLMFLTGRPRWFTEVFENRQHKNVRRGPRHLRRRNLAI